MSTSSSLAVMGTGVKTGCDLGAVATLLGYLTGLLPGVATFLTVVWMALRIWEMETVQGWGKKKRGRRLTKRPPQKKKRRVAKKEEY